ncbi:NAD-dependent epimerase/dehydratase family protein [Candidatus Thorarchaeota archaeon]|nr:MAG: NAD-dependent epimerase/dehydratase family protein [Candidatus Thorarchaeota archaeon]
MSMKAIVTGCAGFIGSHLTEKLLNRGSSVLGVDNLRTGTKQNMATFLGTDRFEFLQMDITNPKLRESVNGEYDALFHLAAISSVRLSCEQPLVVHEINATGTLMMLELARYCNTPRVVFSSSAAVYGKPEDLPVKEDEPTHPLSPYAASKLSAENYLSAYQEAFPIDATILRYFNVFGPRQTYSEYSGVISIFLNQALRGQQLTVEGDGKQTRSFIHVDDVVEATIKAAEQDNAIGQVLNISGTDQISILELASMIDELEKDKKLEILHQPKRPGDVRDSIGSIARAKRVLGFNPSKSLKDGLSETLSWYRNHTE